MRPFIALSLLAGPLMPSPGVAQTLRGSALSVERQRTVAVAHDFTFLRNSTHVQRFVGLGLLVPVRGGPYYELSGVSFPYARPQVRTFVERLSAQYFAACGEPLVVTSLTRPLSRQPRNASEESVHPAGMAIDLRVSNRAACRQWLERTLLSLEERGLAEATRERRPAHYHVAVFPTRYEQFVAAVTKPATNAVTATTATTATTAATATTAPTATADDAAAAAEPAKTEQAEYEVDRGDSLWAIARRFGTSVSELKSLNGIDGDRILPGQRILIPAAGS